jgi:hypothetical protein
VGLHRPAFLPDGARQSSAFCLASAPSLGLSVATGRRAAGDNLANAFQQAGRLGEAIPLCEENLGNRLRVLGPNHPDTLRSRDTLSHAYELAGLMPQTE